MHFRKFHRIIGLVLTVPLFTWALTAIVFFIKPGYDGAYEQLKVKTYPIEDTVNIAVHPEWKELKYVKTVLGEHLIVNTDEGTLHLDPYTYEPRELPEENYLKQLLHDAFKQNPDRYGEVITMQGTNAVTTTGVKISIMWDRLSLYQYGEDTALIDRIYRIHYLQWTGNSTFDMFIGGAGLALLILLAVFGVILFFKKSA